MRNELFKVIQRVLERRLWSGYKLIHFRAGVLGEIDAIKNQQKFCIALKAWRRPINKMGKGLQIGRHRTKRILKTFRRNFLTPWLPDSLASGLSLFKWPAAGNFQFNKWQKLLSILIALLGDIEEMANSQSSDRRTKDLPRFHYYNLNHK